MNNSSRQTPELTAQIAEVKTLTVNQLQRKWAEVFGEPSNARNKKWLIKKICRRIQESAEEPGASEQIVETEEAEEDVQLTASESVQEAEPQPIADTTDLQEDASTEVDDTHDAQEEPTVPDINSEVPSETPSSAETPETPPPRRPRPVKELKTRRADPRIPDPGTMLSREYKGETYQVTVLDDAFEFKGERFTSLSKIAGQITGTSWNGLTFFGLNRRTK